MEIYGRVSRTQPHDDRCKWQLARFMFWLSYTMRNLEWQDYNISEEREKTGTSLLMESYASQATD